MGVTNYGLGCKEKGLENCQALE